MAKAKQATADQNAQDLGKQFLAELTPGERETLGKLRQLRDRHPHDLRWRYEMGQLILKLRRAAAKAGRTAHGSKWFTALAGILGYTPGHVEKMCRFPQEYRWEEVEDLLQLFRSQQAELNWSMFFPLFRVKDRRKRERLLRLAAEKGWSGADLQLAVAEPYKAPRSGTGRPRKGPADVPEGLRQLVRECNAWLAYRDKVWARGEPTLLEQLRGWRPTDKDKALVKEAVDTLQRVGEAVAGLKKALGRMALT
jgi:hypothetical protein